MTISLHRSFLKDEPLHADIEMTTPSRLAKEYVQEIPLDTKGFDNPIYASTPSPAKVGNKLQIGKMLKESQLNYLCAIILNPKT